MASRSDRQASDDAEEDRARRSTPIGAEGSSSRAQGWRRLLPKDPWAVLIGPLTVAVVGAAVIAAGKGVVSLGDDSSGRALLSGAAPLRVFNPQMETESKGGAFRQTRASLPRVDVTLLNRGKSRTVVSGANFVITDGGDLRDCVGFYGAPLSTSAVYDVKLPVPPKVGTRVSAPISQQLGPDEADRFAFRFGSPRLGTFSPDAHLYLLSVSITSDRGTPVDLGKALIALPDLPSPEAVAPFERDGTDLECVRRNQRLVTRLTAGHPAVSPELRRILEAVDNTNY